MSPLIALSLGQSRQVSWIPPLDRHIFTTIAVDQWFLSSPLFAVVAGIIVLSGIAGYFFAPSRWTVGDRSASTVALVWILVPMALFLVYSVVLGNIYVDRYVIFTAPGVALLLGVMISRLTSSWVLASAAVILLAAASLPAYVSQREPWGKIGWDGLQYGCGFSESQWECGRLRRVPAGGVLGAEFVCMLSPRHGLTRSKVCEISASSMMRTRSTSCGIPNIQWTRRPSGHRAARPFGSVTDGERQSYEAILHTANVVWNFEPFHFIDTELFTQLSARGFVCRNSDTAAPLADRADGSFHTQVTIPSTRRVNGSCAWPEVPGPTPRR